MLDKMKSLFDRLFNRSKNPIVNAVKLVAIPVIVATLIVGIDVFLAMVLVAVIFDTIFNILASPFRTFQRS